MDSLPQLKARIGNLQDLRDLFRALRGMAAAHVQEAQAALPGVRRYEAVIGAAIAEGAALLDPRWLRGARAAPGSDRGLCIVICSEHGFAGAFNDHLLDRAAEEAKAGRSLAVIGQRGAALAAERKLDVAWSLPMATHVGGVMGVTRRIAGRLNEAPSVAVIFGAYKKGGGYEIERRNVLPLDPALLKEAATGIRPVHHLPPEELIRKLADEYLFAQLAAAAMETLASENAARLRIMERADHNIEDKLDGFKRREHVLRQESITSELIDAVTGAEAVFSAGERRV